MNIIDHFHASKLDVYSDQCNKFKRVIDYVLQRADAIISTLHYFGGGLVRGNNRYCQLIIHLLFTRVSN